MYHLSFTRKIFSLSNFRHFINKRGILSNSYRCQEQWNQRLKDSCLSNLNAEEFFFKVNERIKKNLPMEAIDLDLFVNISKTSVNFDECLYFAGLLRESWRTIYTLDSTHHAFVRLALDNNLAEKMVSIMFERKKYGIFPDLYALNLLLDHFIESKNLYTASKVAHHIMLQEDFSNEISNIMSLYSLYSCLFDSEQKDMLIGKQQLKEEIVNENQEEEEEEYERVPYLRNPSFDDHFDLTDPLLLTGKSLWLFGRCYSDIIGRTSQLVGLSLYRKWTEANEYLEPFLAQKQVFCDGFAQLITDAVESSPESNENALKLLEKVKNPDLVSESHILNAVKEKFSEIPTFETKDVEVLKSLLEKWTDDRKKAIDLQLENFLRQEKIEEIRKVKKELFFKERLLNFFENKDKHELDHAAALKRIKESKIEELDEEYYPPSVIESLKGKK